MDFQAVINLVGSTALAVMGWFARELWTAVQYLRADLAKLREQLPQSYVTKDDFKDLARELKELLHGIDRKLDGKADK